MLGQEFGHGREDQQKMTEQVVLHLLSHFLTFYTPPPQAFFHRRTFFSGEIGRAHV
jgi:hypothetical protein